MYTHFPNRGPRRVPLRLRTWAVDPEALPRVVAAIRDVGVTCEVLTSVSDAGLPMIRIANELLGYDLSITIRGETSLRLVPTYPRRRWLAHESPVFPIGAERIVPVGRILATVAGLRLARVRAVRLVALAGYAKRLARQYGGYYGGEGRGYSTHEHLVVDAVATTGSEPQVRCCLDVRGTTTQVRAVLEAAARVGLLTKPPADAPPPEPHLPAQLYVDGDLDDLEDKVSACRKPRGDGPRRPRGRPPKPTDDTPSWSC